MAPLAKSPKTTFWKKPPQTPKLPSSLWSPKPKAVVLPAGDKA